MKLLRIVLYLHHRLERVQKHGDLPLSLSQYRLLYMMQQGPARSVELATASGMTKPSIGALVGQLEEKGWIERREVEADRRAASIRITPAGRRAVAKFQGEMHKELERFLGEDTLTRADEELGWLLDVLQERRSQAHVKWALRKSPTSDEAVANTAASRQK